ncbi:hypothetical protein RH858_10920 [Halalkaliarchaeum sp. AArc-GB]|uniref:hypothetical protein n=1 Tax=Halalkaliarchaeum sp. AArc-GB TaxID=3074078 RepID=UPI002854BBA6|nr:hypothetical protein [Halalkaliarchaeum sp. AArc-GB]MDR5673651.1 hypothetical protein [Halalkaliarchaeum sp. AArc-GB]
MHRPIRRRNRTRRKGSPDASDVTDDEGLHLVDHTIRDAGLELLTASGDTSPPSISEAYVLP